MDEEWRAKALSGRAHGMRRQSGVEEKEGEEATQVSSSGCGERQVLWTPLFLKVWPVTTCLPISLGLYKKQIPGPLPTY